MVESWYESKSKEHNLELGLADFVVDEQIQQQKNCAIEIQEIRKTGDSPIFGGRFKYLDNHLTKSRKSLTKPERDVLDESLRDLNIIFGSSFITVYREWKNSQAAKSQE